jgi:putative DNA-invertase from lambdoid prophage Rac
MAVYGYCRVSTTEQASDGASLATQEQQVTEHGIMKGWSIEKFFIDTGFCGRIPLVERPRGRQLLETVTNGDVIIAARLDRAFGSAADALGTLEELREAGTRFHVIDLGGDVCGNGIRELVFTILSAVAENERDRVRDRIHDARRHQASPGIYKGGSRPFGYDIVDGRLARNATEQAAMARIQTLRQQQRPLREISQLIADEFRVVIAPMTVKRILDRTAKLRNSAAER